MKQIILSKGNNKGITQLDCAEAGWQNQVIATGSRPVRCSTPMRVQNFFERESVSPAPAALFKNLHQKNKFSYDMVNDKFSWLVELDNGDKKEILSDISLDFLKNVKEEIEKAAIERENWIQGKKRGSPAVPSRLVE